MINEDTLMVMGGVTHFESSSTRTARAFLYTISTKAWKEVAPMTTRKYGLGCGLVTGDRVFAAGGLIRPLGAHLSVKVFDLATQTWAGGLRG